VKRIVLALALLATPALADDYPPGLFEHSPEIGASKDAPELTCDMQHQCYHMDPAHPDKVTPPPAPQYPGVVAKPFVYPSTRPSTQPAPPPVPQPPAVASSPPAAAPEALAPDSLDAPSEDPSDPYSCFNLRRGIFPTPQAAAHARARCN
jgi:hypothetical protein